LITKSCRGLVTTLPFRNASNDRIAWRILTNAPTRYVVSPNKGFLFKQEKVQIILLNVSKYHRRHAFVVQAKPAKMEENNRKVLAIFIRSTMAYTWTNHVKTIKNMIQSIVGTSNVFSRPSREPDWSRGSFSLEECEGDSIGRRAHMCTTVLAIGSSFSNRLLKEFEQLHRSECLNIVKLYKGVFLN
ncbi:unnamed protein product, partial [Haemonchus placei]|uniref:MSP domain-containing protein n=1 Tax=Haemonchus placei TaxID=6290 RepID=A0A0N4W4N1_HAEPC